MVQYGTLDGANVSLCGRLARFVTNPNFRGWFICFAVLVITVVRSGITYSFGEFVNKLQQTYGSKSMAEQNWIGTLSFSISLSCSPLTVAIVRFIGYRGYRIIGLIGVVILTVSCIASSFVDKLEWMFLTFSVMYGLGQSCVYMSSSLIIGEYFDKEHKHHVLASSILLCGYPVGSLIFNPLNAWLVSRYGWRLAFRVTAGLIFILGIACCSCFVAKNRVTDENQNEEREGNERCCGGHLFFSIKDIKARPEILLWLFGNMLNYLGFYMPFLNLTKYMTLKGISLQESAWALTVLSLAESVSYITSAILGDFIQGKLIYMNIVSSISLSIVCIVWPFVDTSYDAIMGIAAVMGAFLGCSIVYGYAASGEITKLPIDVAWSMTNMWSGFGILAGPLFSGLVYDLRHSYDDVFYVVGVVFALDAITFASIVVVQKWRARKKDTYDEIDGTTTVTRQYAQEYTTTFRTIKRSLSRSALIDDQN